MSSANPEIWLTTCHKHEGGPHARYCTVQDHQTYWLLFSWFHRTSIWVTLWKKWLKTDKRIYFFIPWVTGKFWTLLFQEAMEAADFSRIKRHQINPRARGACFWRGQAEMYHCNLHSSTIASPASTAGHQVLDYRDHLWRRAVSMGQEIRNWSINLTTLGDIECSRRKIKNRGIW